MDEKNLLNISAIDQAITDADNIIDTLHIRDVAMGMAITAQAKGYAEQANRLKASQLKAERQAGTMLAELEKATPQTARIVSQAGTRSTPYAQALEENDIPRTTANRWQQIADMPDEVFHKTINDTLDSGEELSQAKILRTAKQVERDKVAKKRSEAPPLPDEKYRIIYADPPWQYGNSGVIGVTDNYGHVHRHYPSMSTNELCDLGDDIKKIVESDAVMFMWVTSPLLEDSFKVINAWGFKYKTSFVWDKVKHNFGHYNSVRHELLLICTRGSCTPDNQKLFDSVQTIERSTKHSEKPEEFREIIDTLYQYGRRLEMFARVDADNWEAWGNE